MLECVINISEGRNESVLAQLAQCVGGALLDLHTDQHHNRSVFTLLGTEPARVLTRTAVEMLSIDSHDGVHPRLGIVDVVPFVPLATSTFSDALQARNDFAQWAAQELNLPVFFYGPERTLPEVRKSAFKTLLPSVGPQVPHKSAGAVCAGVREPLVAWNIWLRDVDLATTQKIAKQIRSEQIRTLGLQVGTFTQVSCNLISPHTHGPDVAYDLVAAIAPIEKCELVGLIPTFALEKISQNRWETLDLEKSKTIEWRLEHLN